MGSAWAARPFVTDDARLTTAGSCQFESWTRIYRDSKELWALPACNPTGNFEVTFGGAVAKSDGEKANQDYVLQLKTLFRPLETNGWGIGFALGTVKHPGVTPGPNQYGNTYSYVPLSMSFLDDKLIMHINAGVLHDRDSRQNNLTWGVGSEYKLSPRLLGVAEVYGDNRDNPFGQVGFRFSVIPNLFQVDTTLGRQLDSSSENRWISFGVRFTPDKIF